MQRKTSLYYTDKPQNCIKLKINLQKIVEPKIQLGWAEKKGQAEK